MTAGLDPVRTAIATLTHRGHFASISAEETRLAVGEILDARASDAMAAAFLTAVSLKGVNAEILWGAVQAIRERMVAFNVAGHIRPCLDTCGTGGDGASTVNVSTAAAIVVAACGVPVAKHGNRAASGKSGSSDVLEKLGIAIEPETKILHHCLEELGITFLFAPRFHPGLRNVATIRRQLPFRTVFNLVGPLCNPACPAYQLIGVPDPEQAGLLAAVLARTDSIRRAALVTGSDGLDEVTLDGTSMVTVVEQGSLRTETWRAEDFGLGRVPATALRVSSPEESAERLTQFVDGEPGPIRDIVLANAAAALWVVEPLPLRLAVDRAARAIDSGDARGVLRRWASMSRGLRS